MRLEEPTRRTSHLQVTPILTSLKQQTLVALCGSWTAAVWATFHIHIWAHSCACSRPQLACHSLPTHSQGPLCRTALRKWLPTKEWLRKGWKQEPGAFHSLLSHPSPHYALLYSLAMSQQGVTTRARDWSDLIASLFLWRDTTTKATTKATYGRVSWKLTVSKGPWPLWQRACQQAGRHGTGAVAEKLTSYSENTSSEELNRNGMGLRNLKPHPSITLPLKKTTPPNPSLPVRDWGIRTKIYEQSGAILIQTTTGSVIKAGHFSFRS